LSTPRGRRAPRAIVGLGMVGERLAQLMTPSRTAHPRFDCVARERRRRQSEPASAEASPVVPAPVTALLVGSGRAACRSPTAPGAACAVQRPTRAVPRSRDHMSPTRCVRRVYLVRSSSWKIAPSRPCTRSIARPRW
jgi:hypothetical protein